MAGWGFKKGGGWTTYMSSAAARNKRATKQEIANAKLLLPHIQTLSMGHTMQVGISCNSCIHHLTCPLAGKQNYCQFRPGRFVSRFQKFNLPETDEKG